MKILLTAFILISVSLHAQTEYLRFRTTITCPLDKSELAANAHEKLKSALSAMTSGGQLINFTSDKRTSKENIKLIYRISAESEEGFHKILDEWKKRSTAGDPELFANFARTCPTRKDTMVSKDRVMFPLIKDQASGVVVVQGIDEKPDPKLEYKVVVDFTGFPEREGKEGSVDSVAINWALQELGRFYNLHLAAGVPQNKIQIVAAVHANAMESFFTNQAYQEKYKTDNPNLPIIEALSKAGVKFLVCGQSLVWWKYKKEMLIPQAKLTLTAQTTLTSYQMMGYVLKDLGND